MLDRPSRANCFNCLLTQRYALGFDGSPHPNWLRQIGAETLPPLVILENAETFEQYDSSVES